MAKNLHEDFKNRKIKKPSKFIALIARWVFSSISKKRNVKFSYDEDYLPLRKKQVVYLCQHKSSDDYYYVFAGLKRSDVHALCGYQNVFQKYLYTMLKKTGTIAKYLYQPDVQAVKQIFEAVKLGDSIVIFPEGIQSTSGSSHPINPATIKLLKKLKLPVALITIKGSYFTKTRYSRDVKKGEITVRFSKLFDSEDFSTYSQEELYNKLLSNFKYNEFEEFSNNNVEFIGKKPNIDGLNNIIYKCPHCNSEGEMIIENDTMRCKKCDFAIKMDNFYNITSLNKTLPFKNVDDWYKWQRNVIRKEILSDNFTLSSKVRLGKINTEKLGPNYSLTYIGEGTLTITNKGISYKGTKNNENVDLFFDAKAVYSLTISLAYDFDMYYKGEYFNFKLLENEMLMAKYMLASEEIHNLYDKAWEKASEGVYYDE